MGKQKEPESYEGALQELKQILSEIEGEQVSMDELTKNVERAAELIRFCEEKLKHTEHSLDKIMAKIRNPNEDSDQS